VFSKKTVFLDNHSFTKKHLKNNAIQLSRHLNEHTSGADYMSSTQSKFDIKNKKRHSKTKTCIVLVISVIAFLVISCEDHDPVGSQYFSEEYKFCWDMLQIYYIFQDELPLSPTAYTDPYDLYWNLSDPYTIYVRPADAADYYKNFTTETGGIGIWYDTTHSGFVIKDVFPLSPGEQAGLEDNDTIIAIDEETVAGYSFDQFDSLVSDTIGDQHSFTIIRNSTTLTINVTIGSYMAPTVFTDSLDTNIAYILFTSFLDSTSNPEGSAAEMKIALAKTDWAEYTILDLRNNGGGFLKQCHLITSEFIPEGTPFIHIRERDFNYDTQQPEEIDSTWLALTGGTATDRKMYILINKGTASASEILVSGLKEARPSTITTVGDVTFGKGRGQVLGPTPLEGIVKITSLLISPLNSPSYDGIGIGPDISVTGTRDALDVALEDIGQEDLLTKSVVHTKTQSLTAKRIATLRKQTKRPRAPEGLIKKPFIQ